MTQDARLQVKAEIVHDSPHGNISGDRLNELMGMDYVSDVRISQGHEATAIFLTFKRGKYYQRRVDVAVKSAVGWLQDEGYAENIELNRTWLGATDTDN